MSRYHSLTSRTVVLAFMLILVLSAVPVSAQSAEPTITKAWLRLWPEYDDPGLLVIFAGEFSGQASFPRDVSFPLPAGARNVQAAFPDATGNLLVADAEIADGVLTYKQLSAPTFHIEYYVDRQPSGNQREIVHVVQAPYAIAALEVTAQQPARAADFSITPAAESSFTGQDGLTYYTFNRANLTANDRLEISLRYTKTDSGVSRPQLAVTDAGAPAAPAAAPARTDVSTWLPWALIGIGAVALAGLLVYWLMAQHRHPASSAPAQKTVMPARMQRAAAPAPAKTAGFCTQCGRPHRPEDRFCAQCGAPRRD